MEEYIKRFKSFAIDILNDEKKIITWFIILSVYNILANIVLGSIFNISSLDGTNLITLIFTFPLIYGILMKTDFGKRNFKIINVVVSWICLVDFFYFIYLIGEVVDYEYYKTIIKFIYILRYAISMLLDIYWLMSFNFTTKGKMVNLNNDNMYKAVIIMIVINLGLSLYFLKHAFVANLFQILFILIPSAVLTLIQARYIYLYRKYKTSGKDVK